MGIKPRHKLHLKNKRETIKQLLCYCTDKEKDVFIRMYHGTNYPTRNITDIIDKMPSKKLSWAKIQVVNTLRRREFNGGVSTALRLAAQGYAIISRANCIAARIDRPDWRYALPTQLHCRMPGREAANLYQREYSDDKISVSENVRRYMPKSNSCEINEYLDK